MDLTTATGELVKQGILGTLLALAIAANTYQYMKARADAKEWAEIIKTLYSLRLEDVKESAKERSEAQRENSEAQIQAYEKVNETLQAMKSVLEATNQTVQYILNKRGK